MRDVLGQCGVAIGPRAIFDILLVRTLSFGRGNPRTKTASRESCIRVR